jgi:hypothetical protein
MTMMANHREHQPIVIPMKDDLIHTQQHPFCSDPKCPCKEDSQLLSDVARAVEQGLLTPDEATRIAQGQTL